MYLINVYKTRSKYHENLLTIFNVKRDVCIFHLTLVGHRILISELARPLCFHADIFCRDGARSIAWKHCTVI